MGLAPRAGGSRGGRWGVVMEVFGMVGGFGGVRGGFLFGDAARLTGAGMGRSVLPVPHSHRSRPPKPGNEIRRRWDLAGRAGSGRTGTRRSGADGRAYGE